MSVDGHERFLDITTCDFLRSLRQQHHRFYSFLFSSFHVSNKTCKPAKKPNNIPREKRVEDLKSSKQFALHDRFLRDGVSLQCHKGQRYSAQTKICISPKHWIHAHCAFILYRFLRYGVCYVVVLFPLCTAYYVSYCICLSTRIKRDIDRILFTVPATENEKGKKLSFFHCQYWMIVEAIWSLKRILDH